MTSSRIVVGVDGSPEARNALRWAVGEAETRNAVLHVLHAWDAPWNYWDAAVPIPINKVQEQQKELLANEVNVACGEHPNLKVETEIINDLPARALIDRSKDAAMIVVGSRGRGGFSGLLLGSVSQQIVHHAKCPVVVVPAGEHDD